MSWRWGHKREISGHLRAQKLQEAHAIFVKIKKLRSPTETEMGVHGNFKSIQHQVFLRKLRKQSSRKVSSLFRHDPGLCGFSATASAAASLESSAARGQHVRVASPESRTGCLGVVSLNYQLSGGAT